VGYDFSFGKGRKGNPELLKELGAKFGFAVRVVGPITFMGSIVSSTRIRELVLSGRVREAAHFLGREFFVSGKIVAGAGRGKSLGFPTANVDVREELIPLPGVYAVRARVRGETRPGVANVGFNPTFGEKSLRVEVHLFGVDEDLYGEDVRVYFVDRIRDERKFPGPEELAAQIRNDVLMAKKILESS
ncbi:MAG: riboflavin biosynthesis protein RibF, partial [Deltaproteobacteria bacterium]